MTLLWVDTPRHAAGGGYGPGLALWACRCLPGRAPGHQLGSQHLQEQVSSQGAGQATSQTACSWRLSTGCACSLPRLLRPARKLHVMSHH